MCLAKKLIFESTTYENTTDQTHYFPTARLQNMSNGVCSYKPSWNRLWYQHPCLKIRIVQTQWASENKKSNKKNWQSLCYHIKPWKSTYGYGRSWLQKSMFMFKFELFGWYPRLSRVWQEKQRSTGVHLHPSPKSFPDFFPNALDRKSRHTTVLKNFG